MLELISFICGACVMILELAGARVLAPFLGTSFIVWTSLIGVILVALSLGYWLGGKISDYKPNTLKLSVIIFIAGLFILGQAVIQFKILNYIISIDILNLYLKSVIATLILYFIPSFLLGMVSPYIIKVSLEENNFTEKKTGTCIGKFYALSTIGSIVGTFLCGFVLIVCFGISAIFYFISVSVLLCSILALTHYALRQGLNKYLILLFVVQFIIIGICFFLVIYYKNNPARLSENTVFAIDSPYQYIEVAEYNTKKVGLIRTLGRPPAPVQAVLFLDSPQMTANYLELFNLTRQHNPQQKSFLLIGGGGGMFSNYLLDNPIDGMKIDIVEIDPYIIKIAEDFFSLKPHEGISIHNEDGRTFINIRANKPNIYKYDSIYIDAFDKKGIVPFQLITVEAFMKMKKLLNTDGTVSINIFSSVEGDGNLFLRIIYTTMKKVFPYIRIFFTDKNLYESQNIIIISSQSPINIDNYLAKNKKIAPKEYLKEIVPVNNVYTDNYAPVEELVVSWHKFK